jgi:hypothetical protein
VGARGGRRRLNPERNRLVGSVPADGWDLAVGSDQTVWTTSGNRLLGLDRGVLRHTLPLGQLGSDRINAITPAPTPCGWRRRPGCSASTWRQL